MTTNGETMVKRYVRMPAPVSTVQLANGMPDNHAAMTVASNAAWMGYESCRHLIYSTSQTTWKSTNTQYDAYNGLVDFVPPSSPGSVQPWQEIPWDRRTAMRFGPFMGVADEIGPSGLATLRKIRFEYSFDFITTTSNLATYVAMTQTSSPADLYGSSAGGIAFVKTILAAPSGTIRVTLVPDLRVSLSSLQQYPADSAATVGTAFVSESPFWLWLGVNPYFIGGGSGSVAIDGISAREVR